MFRRQSELITGRERSGLEAARMDAARRGITSGPLLSTAEGGVRAATTDRLTQAREGIDLAAADRRSGDLARALGLGQGVMGQRFGQQSDIRAILVALAQAQAASGPSGLGSQVQPYAAWL